MEHMNQEIEAYLCIFISHQQDDWANWLPLAEFAYNNKVHVATHQTPFELDAGQHPHLGVEPTKTSTVEAAVSWYDLPSPSPPTSGHLQPHLPPLHPICLHSAPTPKHTCATYATMSCPLLA